MLKGSGASSTPSPKKPLWQGPEKDGITFSMLSRFLVCRERFRVQYIEGLRPAKTFNHRIEFGQMWHTMEEALAAGRDTGEALRLYCEELCELYPMQREQIDHWYNVCKVTFPEYVKYWTQHPDVKARTPVLQEQVFDVPYQLPSGRIVRLRGKWDSVDLIAGKLWLMENKTKGDINEGQMVRQLTFDLQTMMYVTALKMPVIDGVPDEAKKVLLKTPLGGVRYNVVRRPLSGGKGTIVRHKATKTKPEETKAHYYQRVKDIISGAGEEAPGPEYFFMRWNVSVMPQDITGFRQRCLDPILEQLYEWYEALRFSAGTPFQEEYNCHDNHGIHWQHPFGVYNVLDEGGSTDLDDYLMTGNPTGLVRSDKLFEELG